MSRLIDEITDDIIEISEEVSTEYEITSILKNIQLIRLYLQILKIQI